MASTLYRRIAIYSGRSTLPVETLLQQSITYDGFESFRGGLADSYGRIALSPDSKSLMFYDLQVRPSRTYLLNLESGKISMVDEGDVWNYGWSMNTLVLAKEFDYQKQVPTGKIVLVNSKTDEKIISQMNDSYYLVPQAKWGAVSADITGNDFYNQKFYSPNNKYYMKFRIKRECMLRCSFSIEALDFYRENGEKVGEYYTGEYRVLSKTYFADTWTQDNNFIVFDRSLDSNLEPTQYDSRYYPQTFLGRGEFKGQYKQIWTVKKLIMPE